MSFLVAGHTHSGLGVAYGQLAVKLRLKEFSTDMEVVDLLARFAEELGVDAASQAASKCYKLDEVAPWCEWAADVGVYFNNLTGPDAPRYFRIGLRCDLATAMPIPHSAKAESIQELDEGCGIPLTRTTSCWSSRYGCMR